MTAEESDEDVVGQVLEIALRHAETAQGVEDIRTLVPKRGFERRSRNAPLDERGFQNDVSHRGHDANCDVRQVFIKERSASSTSAPAGRNRWPVAGVRRTKGRSSMVRCSLGTGMLLLVMTALSACTAKKSEGSAAGGDAATTAAAANAAGSSVPTKFDRKYAGAVGENAKATMHLVRDGERVSGEYAYTRVGRSIGLGGTATGDGALTLQETVAGKSTGEFKGQIGSDGAFTGTWTNPGGDKKLPFRFDPSNDAVVPPLAAAEPAPAKGKPILAANKDEAADALVKIAKSKGATVDRATAAKDFDDLTSSEYAKDGGDRRKAFATKYGLDFYTGFVSLYIGDADNDGKPDYVFTEKNPVGLHNDDVVAVFLGKGDKVAKTKLPDLGAPLAKTAFDFSMSVDPEGTVMYFTEAGGPKGKVHRVLWKGTTVKHL
jgi:hypothetical protein